jgi:cytoskeletal protein CcmA (bactofilin family)
MSRIDDLTNSEVPRLLASMRDMQTGTPMNNSAVGRSGIEVYDGGVLNVSDGNLVVNGTATISGVLNADGTVTLSGTVKISGPFTVSGATTISGDTDITGDLSVTGPTHLNGATDINGTTDVNGALNVDGTLDINGVSTLNNDLNVTGGGKIKAGVTQLNPDGTVSFGSGKRITPDNGTGSFAVEAGAASMQLTPSNADYHAQFSGGGYFQGLIRGMGLKLTSLPTSPQPANLYIDASGNVFKSTA